MSYDGWFEYDGFELVNLSRTAQLSESLGITSVWTTPDSVGWVQDALAGTGYDDIENAPWYVDDLPASAEFAGVLPLSVEGLKNSSLESTPIEYVTDGGHSGKPRNATLPLVWSVALVASTDRGAEYGLRWLNHRLRNTGPHTFCSGATLRYFRSEGAGSEVVHRRDVRLTRGSSVTRKAADDCQSIWFVTFTMTAADPYEYGAERFVLTGMGASTWAGPSWTPTAPVSSAGKQSMVNTSCPVWDYSPIYDPLYPALVPSPAPPQVPPNGWTLTEGSTFQRFWGRTSPIPTSTLPFVPMVRLTSTAPVRTVRVSIYPQDAATTAQCDALWSCVVTYLPAGTTFYLDGEQKASYVWDGLAPVVRRTDSLVYAPDASPIRWASLVGEQGFLVTLDVFGGVTSVRMSLGLVPKSD